MTPERKSAADYLPERMTMSSLRSAASCCEGCELYLGATQTVFGIGSKNARLVLVGETPGDREDIAGKPFVGPAGAVLNRALAEASLDRKEIYLTNAVKHFAFEERGKRRLHKKPKWRQVVACRPWLDAEIRLVRPQLIVCLGATAAQSLLGSAFRVTRDRGRLVNHTEGWPVIATYHPSAILRVPAHDRRQQMYDELVSDLRTAAAHLDATPGATV